MSANPVKDVDLFLTPTDLAKFLGITVQGLSKQIRTYGISTVMEKSRHKIYPREVRKLLSLKGASIPNEVVALHIVKGGVGKTTLVHGLAARASALGFRTLLIDLDQQANLTSSFGIYTRPKEHVTLLEVVSGHMNGKAVSIKDAVVSVTDFLHIVPANLTIANLDLQLIQGNENLGTFFKNLLKPIRKNYDLIFIDCPPSLSRVTAAAHCYADKIVLPVNIDRFSLDGLELTLDHLANMREKFQIEPSINIVLNKFDARQTILGNAVVDALATKYKEFLMKSYVSVSKQIDNCIAMHECIWNSKPAKNPALADLDNLLMELFDLDEWKKLRKAPALSPKELQERFANV